MRLTLLKIMPLMVALAITASAATEPKLVTVIGKSPIVLGAPFPFVEASQTLPDLFAARKKGTPDANQLIAWFVPTEIIREYRPEKPVRYRSLQIQVMRQMEDAVFASTDIGLYREEIIKETPNIVSLTPDTIKSIFSVLNLSQLENEPGAQRILGIATQAPDSFTLCIATSFEGKDQRGGHDIELSVAAISYVLVKDKILILTVSGPEMTSKELGNTLRITREWITQMREQNQASNSGVAH